MKLSCLLQVTLILAAVPVCTGMESDQASKPVHDVAITDISMPAYCTQGDIIPIAITVVNQGTRKNSFRVTVRDCNSGEQIASHEVTLGKGWKAGEEDIADVVFDTHNGEADLFGNHVCLEGDVSGDGIDDVLISATNWNNNTGRVFLYLGGDNEDLATPNMVFTGEEPNSYFGNYSGICCSDLNKDGFEDAIISARGYHNNDGRVYVFYGGHMLDAQADLILDGEEDKSGMFGLGVASADIDNDGYEDIIVGAQNYDNGRGRVYLFWGGNPVDTTADLILEGETSGDWFGRKIDANGDVNGDGFNDILIGARQWGDDNRGRAYLFFGGEKMRMDAICDHVFSGDSASDNMGSSVELFDINNDEFAEAIIGARYAADYRGRVYLYWGKRGFGANKPDLVLEGEPGSHIGGDEIACGYFNSDEYGDILAGAMGYPDPRFPENRMGCAYIFNGNTKELMDTQVDHRLEGESGHSGRFGTGLSSGDFNNDHYDDVVIGAWGYNKLQGRAYLYYGPLSDTEDITFKWDTTNASIGKHTLKVEIPPVQGEQNTEDNVTNVTIEVRERQQ